MTKTGYPNPDYLECDIDEVLKHDINVEVATQVAVIPAERYVELLKAETKLQAVMWMMNTDRISFTTITDFLNEFLVKEAKVEEKEEKPL